MFRNLLLHNWFAILFFNLKMLPLKQALFFPFDFYGKVRFVNLKGKVSLKTSKIRPGMIKLGSQGRDMFPNNPIILDIRGHLEFKGYFYLGCGSTIRVEPNATLIIGDKSRFGANSILFCEDKIQIGKNVEVSWGCQVMDTDRHEIRDIQTGQTYISHSPITICDNVWIGNHVFLNKGTYIPNDTIIASNSLCNKNYSTIPQYSVLGGIPAKIIGSNKVRIWER